MSHYDLEINDALWRACKSKAALEGITLKDLIVKLIMMWIEGRVKV